MELSDLSLLGLGVAGLLLLTLIVLTVRTLGRRASRSDSRVRPPRILD